MKTVKINDIEFRADEIRNATWTTESSDLSVYVCEGDDHDEEIERDDENKAVIKWTATSLTARVEDEEPWEAAWTHVTALDGKKYTIYVEDSYDSKTIISEGWVEAYTSGDPSVETIEDEDGWELQTSDLSSICDTMPNLSVGNGMPEYDAYESEAERYIEQLPDTAKIWLDRMRGFANEWAIYIDLTGEIEPRDEWEPADESHVASYLADAICPADVYHDERLSESCVSAWEIDQ